MVVFTGACCVRCRYLVCGGGGDGGFGGGECCSGCGGGGEVGVHGRGDSSRIFCLTFFPLDFFFAFTKFSRNRKFIL